MKVKGTNGKLPVCAATRDLGDLDFPSPRCTRSCEGEGQGGRVGGDVADVDVNFKFKTSLS